MSDDATNRSRLFWRLQIGGWAAYGLLASLFLGAISFDARAVWVFALCRTVFGLIATSSLRPLYRFLRRSTLPIAVSGSLVFLLCGALALVDNTVIRVVAQMAGVELEEQGVQQFLSSSILMRWMVYWLWSLLYFGFHFRLDTEEARLREVEARAEAQENELRFLRAQINPHFLFNALNTVLAETPHPQTRALVQALADYLRFSFSTHAPREPLGVELEALSHYLAVEKARFLEKLVYRIEVTDEARATLAPVASIQPLLENAIKYGRQTSPERLEVEITARVEAGRLLVRVWNSGEWVAPEAHHSTRTGLANLERRLALLYSGEATLQLSHHAPGVSAELSLPAT